MVMKRHPPAEAAAQRRLDAAPRRRVRISAHGELGTAPGGEPQSSIHPGRAREREHRRSRQAQGRVGVWHDQNAHLWGAGAR
jgi:hypothetical protein